MARGKRRSLEEQILERQEYITGLETRLAKEREALEALLSEQRMSRLETLDEMIKSSNLSVDEAAEILNQYISSQNAIVA